MKIEQQDIFLFLKPSVGPSHHTAPETSPKAARDNAPRSGTQRARVLQALPPGRTDEEISVLTGLPLNSVRPRRLKLLEGGYIQNSGATRKTSSGSEAVIWTPTQKGMRTIRELTEVALRPGGRWK